MHRSGSDPFQPPTADQMREHLIRYSAVGPSRWLAWLPVIALGAVLALLLTAEGWLSVLPWSILLFVFAFMSFRIRQMRRFEQQVVHLQELSTLLNHREALRLSWTLLPRLSAVPELHSRVVALVGHNLDQLRSYDAAIVAFEHLIDRLPQEHPGSIQLRIQRTLAQLATDQLTDADEGLRRLRGFVELEHPNPMGAAYRLAGLFQQIRTHHWSDAVQGADRLLTQLRPLGIEAGYGHAMLALSFHHLNPAEHPAAPDQAALWWSRATLLMPSVALIDRLPELSAIVEAGTASTAPSDDQ